MAANELARVYASSLVELAQEKDILSDIVDEFCFVVGLVDKDKDLRAFLTTPGISKKVKKGFIDSVFGGKLTDLVLSFLKVLIDNDRQMILDDISEALEELIDEINGKQRVSVITKEKLDASLLKKIKEKLHAKFNKDIVLEEIQDTSILGGIVIKVGDIVIDGSLAKDLRNIRYNLLNSKIRSEAAYED